MQTRAVLIELVLFFILTYSIPYVGWVFIASSSVRILFPNSKNKVVEIVAIPIQLLRTLAMTIDQKLP